MLAAAWALAATAVLCQVAYPITGGGARDRLTVLTVAVTFAAMAAHASARLGVRGAAALLGTSTAAAFVVEVLGAGTGIPFGGYDYGGGLGPALLGVPLAVPFAWAMTAYPALLVGRRLTRGRGPAAVAAVAGWALASWDVFLDPQMVAAGHWRWHDPTPALPGSPGVPLTNYAGWVVVAVALMAVLDRIYARRLDAPASRPHCADSAVRHAGSPDSRGSPALSGRIRGRRGSPAPRPDAARDPDVLPGLLYLWTYGAQVLANAAFFGRPAVAVLGGVAMGVVAIPYARTLRAR